MNSSYDNNDATYTILYDGFGRVMRETRQMPTATVSRETRYDALGRVHKVSEWQSVPSSFTTYTYDQFGRPASITAPDSSVTSFSYLGIRQASRTSSVGTALSGASTVTQSPITVTERYDHHGRLTEVQEPGVLTQYVYDGADRLRSVTMNGGATQAARSFTYDGRGFLLQENHPESGTTTYSDYDARGHAGRKDVGNVRSPFDLEFTYDDAERLVEVGSRYPAGYTEPAGGDGYRLTKEFEFNPQGKLARSARHNHVPGIGVMVVDESYFYEDLARRLTRKETTIWRDVWGSDPVVYKKLEQSFTYDDLGQATHIVYPRCLEGASCGVPSWTALSQSYSKGYLQTIGGFVNGVTYHPSGVTNTITHSNGTAVQQAADLTEMARPRSIQVSGATECGSPAITSQPQSVSVLSGQSATLGVTVSGTPTIAYQWYKGWPGDTEFPVAGATSATFTTPPLTAPERYWVKVTSSCGYTVGVASVGITLSASAAVTVVSPLSSLSASPSPIRTGAGATGTVSIAPATALAGGQVVQLTASSGVGVPASVTIPEGASSVTFAITTVAGSIGNKVITATSGPSSRSTTLTLRHYQITSFVLPAEVVEGNVVEATVTLEAAAYGSGLSVALTKSGPATVPTSVIVPAGQKSAKFSVTGLDVSSATPLTISVSYQGQVISQSASVVPLAMVSYTLSPSSIHAYETASGTVTMNGKAVSGWSASIIASSLLYARNPGTVYVTAGQSSGSFVITPNPDQIDRSRTVAYTVEGVRRTVQIVPYVTLTCSPGEVKGGGSVTLTVATGDPAPAGGAVVELQSSSTKVVVPATVTIPAGQTSVTVTITTRWVSSTTAVTITGTTNGRSGSTILMVLQ